MIGPADDVWMGSPSLRPPEFAVVSGTRDCPVMFDLSTAPQAPPAERYELYTKWRSLPPPPYMFELVGPGDELMLRFAAIDWRFQPLRLSEAGAVERAATLGILFTRVFDFLTTCIPLEELGWFCCPFVKMDLEGLPRVGFWPPTTSAHHVKRVAPEVLDRWPHADERALVFAVGQLLFDTVLLLRADLATPLGKVIRICLATDPANRYARLAELRNALAEVGGRRNSGYRALTREWELIENGLGLLLLDRWDDALAAFDEAARDASAGRVVVPVDGERGVLIARGREAALARGAVRPSDRPVIDVRLPARWSVLAEVPRLPRSAATWADVAPKGARLEANHDPRAAIPLYLSVREADAHLPELNLALARTHLAAGDHGHAVDYARRVLALLPTSRDAHRIKTAGFLGKRMHDEALGATNAWEAVAPDDARLHYLRGKALFGLSRLADARDAFDRALALDGTMIEAMLLRREADRHLRRNRAEVGEQVMAPAIPPELGALLAGDRTVAIDALSGPAYAEDLLAQLLLGELLVIEQRYTDALGRFERCAKTAEYRARACCGGATALLELGRPADALALLAGATDLDALDLRVRALRRLGRDADADAEQAKLDAAILANSSARVATVRR